MRSVVEDTKQWSVNLDSLLLQTRVKVWNIAGLLHFSFQRSAFQHLSPLLLWYCRCNVCRMWFCAVLEKNAWMSLEYMRCLTLLVLLIADWTVPVVFSPKHMAPISLKKELECSFIWPHHMFPLCVGPSQMALSPETSVLVPLDKAQ